MMIQKPLVTTRTTLLFMTLNFIAVATISYALLRFAIEQRRRAQERLEQSRKQVQMAKNAADTFFATPLI
jgi:hypothetical protein